MITLAKAAEISKSRIDTLHPDFRKKVHDWYQACVQENPLLIPYVYEGFRTMARQAELFKLGSHVTRAQPGQSYHNYGFAIDWVPITRHEKANGMYETVWDTPIEEVAYKQGEELARKFGMNPISWESGHLQDSDYPDWTDLKNKFVTLLR